MTIEAAIAAVHAADYRVHNLFEREGGGWQANLSARTAKGRVYSEFAIAATPELALAEALRQAAPINDTLLAEATRAIVGTLSPTPAVSLFD